MGALIPQTSIGNYLGPYKRLGACRGNKRQTLELGWGLI